MKETMERLTERDEYGNADIIALSDMMPEIYAELSFGEANALTDALNRLAAYEDTGLTPKEIRELIGLSINNPLTLEELREMDGEPVWVKEKQQYGILKVDADRFMVTFDPFEYSTALFVQMGNQIGDITFYRCRPEEGTE